VQSIVLHPVPGVRASQLYWVEPRTATGTYPGTSWREFQDLRARLTTVRRMLAFRMAPLYVGPSGRTERAYGLLVSDNYFDALDLRPARGRFFRPDEVMVAGRAPVIVISYQYWQKHFDGDPTGRTIRVNGTELTVIGVAPPAFQGTVPRLAFDLFVPATLAPVVLPGSRELDDRSARGYTIVAGVEGGVSASAARDDVDRAMAALARIYPDTNAGVTAELLPFWRALRGPQRFLAAALVSLQGVLLLLLLSICSNAANLALARATTRHRETGIRLALGAAPARIAALVLTEYLMIALAAAAIGAAIAWWGSSALRAVPPLRVRGLPVTFDTSVDLQTLAFASVLGILCGLLFGLPSAVQLARVNPLTALTTAARTATRSALRNAIMGVQVALATVVLIAGGFALVSFAQTRDAPTGFRRGGLLLAEYDLTGRGTNRDGVRAFAARTLRAVAGISGVDGVALAASVPLDIHGLPTRSFTVEGHARTQSGSDEALTNTVSPGYFRVMDIPFVAGSDFADLDSRTSAPQAIVNDAFVREFLPGLQPVGRILTSRERRYVICGVVRTSISDAFDEPPTPVVYYSYRDNPLPMADLHVGTRAGGERAVAGATERVVRGLDPEVPVYDIRTMNEHIDSNLLFRTIPARLFAIVGPLLLALAAIGVYATAAYSASLRRPEIGVRLALGAPSGRVVAQLVGETLAVVIAGVMVGVAIAAVAVLDVFGTGPDDVAVFGAVAALLVVTAAAASWMPTYRAAGLDPAAVLRRD
jgi:predicted permease